MKNETAKMLQKAFNDGVVVDTYAMQLQALMEDRYGTIDDGNDELLYGLLYDLTLYSRCVKSNISEALKIEFAKEKGI
ncbi:hypothetical protein N8848_01170 [Gammaproteobacteria bacterium]|jgi:hypothetical protein|nr:hypothetical protein [Gammaproteobacteria bacterium]